MVSIEEKAMSMNRKLIAASWIVIIGITSYMFVRDGRPEALIWFIPLCMVFLLVSGMIVNALRKV